MPNETTTVLSYHGSHELKAACVKQARRHAEADMLIKQVYGDNEDGHFRGCSVGCFANDIRPGITRNWHRVVAEHDGLPEWLIHLNDVIFEGLDVERSRRFHQELREAIPVGVDLEPVRHKLAMRRIDRLVGLQKGNLGKHGAHIDAVIEIVIGALLLVRRCHECEIQCTVCEITFEKAQAAAKEAAKEATRSAWSVAKADAEARSARAAAWSACSAAEAAQAAADAEAQAAAWSARAAARSAAEVAQATAEEEDAVEAARWQNEAADLLALLIESGDQNAQVQQDA